MYAALQFKCMLTCNNVRCIVMTLLYMLLHVISQLQSYAFRGADGGKHRGNFAKYCSNTKFVYNSEIMANVAVVGFIILVVFILFAPALLHDCVQEYLLPDKGKEKSPNYNYTYGIFLGIFSHCFLFRQSCALQ